MTKKEILNFIYSIRNEWWILAESFGAVCHENFDKDVTHIVASNVSCQASYMTFFYKKEETRIEVPFYEEFM